METIYVGYVPSDQQLGQALVTALQRTGAQVWDDSALQRATEIEQATVFQACHQFIVVLSRDAINSQQLRSQALHYVTLHHRSADYHVTLVMREPLLTRDLWLFIRHFPRIEGADHTEAALVAQVVHTIALTAQRKPATRLTALLQQAEIVQGAFVTPSRFRRSWARTWRLQIIAGATVLLLLLAFLVSSTLLVKHVIIDKQQAEISSTAIPSVASVATATVGLRPIFQATSTPLPRPTPSNHVTPTATATPGTLRASPTPMPTVAVATAPKLRLPLNNMGISDDAMVTQANYDSAGFSYSAQTLQAAGFVAGASITSNGVTFTWPNFGANVPDNVLAAGQVIALATVPTATTIAFLGSATEGPSSGTGTLTYIDGSTQSFTLEFSDWALGGGNNAQLTDNVIVATLPYRNDNQAGRDALTVYIFATEVALTPGKALASVTLPTNSGPGALHIFAIGTK